MMIIIIIVIIILSIIGFFLWRKKKKSKHALTVYESPSVDPIKDTGKYQDEIDYFMTPVVQATRLENNPVIDKKALYNTYNEAVARYNKVSSKVKKHPRVPNIETIVGQRDRAYKELVAPPRAVVDTEMPIWTPPVAVDTPWHPVNNTTWMPGIAATMRMPGIAATMQMPIPVLKDKKREDRLKVTIKSSAQNVHDHNVNDELSNRYRKLKESGLPPKSDMMYAEMLEFIDRHDPVRKITDRFASCGGISRFNNDKEDEIWSTVWRRIHAPENVENIDSLKNAFRDAVVDCTENNNLVCTTGRVTRVLDSLTLLDNNENISKPIRTDDIERKEIYDQAHQILHRELDKKGVDFKNSYESGEMRDTDAFDEQVKECIKKEVGASKYLDDALAAI